MDLLICLLVKKSEFGPTLWIDHINHFYYMEFIVNVIFKNTRIAAQIVSDEKVIDFLKESQYIPKEKISSIFLYRCFFAKNASYIIEHYFNNDKLSLQEMDFLDQRRYQHNNNLTFHESIPFSIYDLKTIEKIVRKNTVNTLALAIQTNELDDFVPYFDIILQELSQNKSFDIIILLQNMKGKKDPNLNGFMKFLKIANNNIWNSYIFKKFAKDSIIPQVFLFSQTCWSDATLDACDVCVGCEDKWINALPQWRCVAICYSQQRQCLRFTLSMKQDFCKHHMMQQKNQKVKKREYESSLDLDLIQQPKIGKHKQTKKYFKQEEIKNQYPWTKRYINAMNAIAPHRTTSRRFTPGFYLPITRYEGLYYENSGTSSIWCGKFFYYEPQSNVYVHLGKSCLFASKIHAYFMLAPTLSIFDAANAYFIIGKYKFPVARLKFLKKGVYNYISLLDSFRSNKNNFFREKIENWLDSFAGFEQKLKHFDEWMQYHFCTVFDTYEATFQNTFYRNACIPLFYPEPQEDEQEEMEKSEGAALFDFFDQDICKFAKEKGFDTIVIQHEIGTNDCNTEILHTNNFKDNLFRSQNGVTQKQQSIPILPKIWFLNSNGIINEQAKLKLNYQSNEIFVNVFDSNVLFHSFQIMKTIPLVESYYLPIFGDYLQTQNIQTSFFQKATSNYIFLGEGPKIFATKLHAFGWLSYEINRNDLDKHCIYIKGIHCCLGYDMTPFQTNADLNNYLTANMVNIDDVHVLERNKKIEQFLNNHFFSTFNSKKELHESFIGPKFTYDFLNDQIKNYAQKLGIEVMIFQRQFSVEAQSHITQVWKSNASAECFNIKMDEQKENNQAQDTFSRIWFPNDDGIVLFNEEENKLQWKTINVMFNEFE